MCSFFRLSILITHILPARLFDIESLGAQSIDSNALLGNANLSYKYSFFAGAVLPIGLDFLLILKAIFLARFINQESIWTFQKQTWIGRDCCRRRF
jgi:hypothetical protein